MSATWKTVRVFISSTFRDMQAERDHLVRFVFPSLREELLARRIHLLDVDLRWGVTRDQDASEVCREVVDECHPRFLCMLGAQSGKCLTVVADDEASKICPEWSYARVKAKNPERLSLDFFVDASARTTHLRHKFIPSILAAWNADSDSRSRVLLSNGTTVVTQDNYQVNILKLFYGNRRISLAEAEEILALQRKKTE